MSLRSCSLSLLTCADLGGRRLFRSLPLELSVRQGGGRVWLEGSGGGADLAWQSALRNAVSFARRAAAADASSLDLFVSPRGQPTLSGRSASLPLFVAALALLAGVPLPQPFLATGVAEDGSDGLVPAPRHLVQGKLDFANALVRQRYPGRVVRVWVPAGSDFDPAAFPLLEVRPAARLLDAAREALGEAVDLGGRAPAPLVQAGSRG